VPRFFSIESVMTATRTNTLQRSSPPGGASKLQRLRVEALATGDHAYSRIYDMQGRLLLGEGVMLTNEMKQALKARGIVEVLAVIAPPARPNDGDADDLAAERVLNELDRQVTRAVQKRQRPRRRFRERLDVGLRDVEPAQKVRVWTRNLSERGLGFICRTAIHGQRVIVRLPTATLTAEIVRRRETLNGFWEYGVAFSERVDGRRRERGLPTACVLPS
jgi:hypothetical protein